MTDALRYWPLAVTLRISKCRSGRTCLPARRTGPWCCGPPVKVALIAWTVGAWPKKQRPAD